MQMHWLIAALMFTLQPSTRDKAVVFVCEHGAAKSVVATAYFNKLACFCFSEQTLKPGERVEMPVQFFIDPAIAGDKDLTYVDAITLSYTFYPAREPAKPLASARPQTGSNPL